MKYEKLNDLLKTSTDARNFFMGLPDYVQGGIMLHSSEIDNEEDLHKCAEFIIGEFR